MKNTLIFIIILDAIVMLGLSALTGFAFFLMGFNFWASSILTLIGLILLGVGDNKFRKSRNDRLLAQIEYETAKLNSEQTIVIDCAYCRTSNQVKFRFIDGFTFNCINCKHPNLVVWQCGAARITTPLDEKIDINEVNMEVDSE